MSVCKGGVGSSTKSVTGSRDGAGSACKSTTAGEGKENSSLGQRLRMFSGPSPTKAKGGGGRSGGGDSGGSGGRKDDAGSDANAFDLMPPPLPRTPGKGKAGSCPSRSSVLSPLGRHDPNLQQSPAGGDGGNSGGNVGRGRAAEKVGRRGRRSSVSFPAHLHTWRALFVYWYMD